MTVHESIEVGKPAEEVFDFLVDEENMYLWIDDLIRWELISGEAGEVGAKALLTYLEKGRNVERTETIVECVPGIRLVTRLSGPRLECIITNEVHPLSEYSCRFTGHIRYRPRNWKAFITLPFRRSSLEARLENELTKFKKAVEQWDPE